MNGRKRHLLVDTDRLVLEVAVHPADLPEREEAELLLNEQRRETFPRLRHLWADAGYRGAALRGGSPNGSGSRWRSCGAGAGGGMGLQGRPRARPHLGGLRVDPQRRRVVERTFARISRNRRMSRDYEFLAETAQALIHSCMIRLMLKGLAGGVV